MRFGSVRLWYAGPNAVSNAVGFAKFFSRSHRAVIRVYDQMGHANRLALARLSRELRRCDLTKQRK
jgi:hypothetical protein